MYFYKIQEGMNTTVSAFTGMHWLTDIDRIVAPMKKIRESQNYNLENRHKFIVAHLSQTNSPIISHSKNNVNSYVPLVFITIFHRISKII